MLAIGLSAATRIASAQACVPPVATLGAAKSAANPGDSPIFVLNFLDANISIIDPRSYRELRRVPTGKVPHHRYLTPDERARMVANTQSDCIAPVDSRSGVMKSENSQIAHLYPLSTTNCTFGRICVGRSRRPLLHRS